MKFILNKKSSIKFGKMGLIIFSIALLGFLVNFIPPSFADVNPGQLQGYNFCGGNPCPTWVNLTRGDMFFANGNSVYVIANISCTQTHVCNSSAMVDANFSQIGGNQVRAGIFQRNGTNGGWAIFEFNDTVNFASLSVQQIQPKNITMNASIVNDTTGTYGTFDMPSLIATVLLVNMSTFGCPPAGGSATFPTVPGWNISSGTAVITPTAAVGCTQNATICAYMDTYGGGTWDETTNQWRVCAPTFGGATTNLTSVAATGNFSAISSFTIEASGKGKIVFNTNVSFGSQQESQAIMEFAMKSLMSGGKIGMDSTEWNGINNRPNLNLSATLTIYNISQYFSINGKPQIFRYPTHLSAANSQMCPSNICSGFTWDGQNISFTVSSFSDYGLNDSINVTLQSPTNFTNTSTTNLNFTFTPQWSTDVNIKNCTLFTNVTGTWAANTTNATILANNVLNGINISVWDGKYSWNVYCYDTTEQYDYYSPNWTVTIDTAKPQWSSNSTSKATGVNYTPNANYGFQIDWTDASTVSTALFEWNGQSNQTSTRSGNTYYYNITDRAVGTYTFRWYANDTAGNWNSTVAVGFVISQSTPSLNISTLNTVVYGTSTQRGCQRISGDSTSTITLLRNGTQVNTSTNSYINDTTILAAGNYNYTCNISATTNYTYGILISQWGNVSQAVNQVHLYFNNGTQYADQNITTIYGTNNATGTALGGTVYLSRNDTIKSSCITPTCYSNETTPIGVELYTYKVNASSNVNYTENATGITYYLTVYKAPTNITIYLNGTDGNYTYVINRVANITAKLNVSGKNVNLTTDISGWVDQTGATPLKNYTTLATAGTYNITGYWLGDENYTSDTETVFASVVTTTVTTTTSTSGGGGGGGTPGQKLARVTYMFKELKKNTIEKWKINQPGMGLIEMNITVKNPANNVQITIERFDKSPVSITHQVTGKIYQYMEISKTNLNENDIDKIHLKININKSWIVNNNIDESTVALNRYNNGLWEKLKTTKTGDDKSYVYYLAETPGLSTFAVTGEVKGGTTSIATTTILTTIATTIPTTAKTCMFEGERCGSGYLPCCTGLTCKENKCVRSKGLELSASVGTMIGVTIVLIVIVVAIMYMSIQKSKKKKRMHILGTI